MKFSQPHSFTPRLHQEATGGAQAGEGAQEAGHQETSERLHALHEGDEGKGHRRVHIKRERSHQSDPGTKGEGRTHTQARTLKSRLILFPGQSVISHMRNMRGNVNSVSLTYQTGTYLAPLYFTCTLTALSTTTHTYSSAHGCWESYH